MKRRNPRFGCRKIAEQISMAFGIELNKDVVRRILVRFYRPVSGGDGPSWLSVIGHAKDSLWSVDLFRCESILLKSYWITVVMDVFTRRIVGFGVAPADLDGPAVCGCSITRSLGRERRDIFLRITIHCFGFTGGLRICVFSKSMRSKPSRVRPARRLSSRDLSERCGASIWIGRYFGTRAISNGSWRNTKSITTNIDVTPGWLASRPLEVTVRGSYPVAQLASYRWRRHCHGLFHTPIAA
jgi:putative transposase